ncbi:MAG: sulfurtransferase [Chitinophagaceae bacterium]|nr:MAG: sulfurtransferase [Chitinophagaceae bacterium]
MNSNHPFVSVTWLFENRNLPELIVIDASLKDPVKAEHAVDNKIIPNALQFDWDAFSDLSNPLPHTMPDAAQFTRAAQALGVNTNSLLVVYDKLGIYASPRVWWMFLAMGFKNCYVLDGGLPEWLKMGYNEVKAYAEPHARGNFTATFDEKLISNRHEVLRAANDNKKLIIDARSANRFQGKIAEPRAGVRRGHIPNSINIPFESLLFEHKIRPNEELEKLFSAIHTKNLPLIFSCGSGITACIGALAATLVGYQNISVYDGSWSEWGMN